jgi:translation initiation factor 2 beta subunit (eIF-2beta)/eIF-5
MDRASYEAGFRAAQEQNLQQPPEQGNQFLDAVGKTALGLGIAAGAGITGRRLMRGRGFGAETAQTSQKPTRRQEVEQNARIAASELQKRTGSLQTGVKLPLASEVAPATGPVRESIGNVQGINRRRASLGNVQGIDRTFVPEVVQASGPEVVQASGPVRESIGNVQGINRRRRSLGNVQGIDRTPASEVAQGVPTAEQRRAAYAVSAAKPEADLPAVTRPTSGANVELIRETTGELRLPGQSPKDYDDAADRFLRKYEGEYTQTKQRQEAAEIGRESQRQTKEVAQDILAELKEEAEGNFANEYLVQKQYVDANASQQLLEEGAVTSVQKQQMVEGQVSNQSAEAIDTGADQEAMRVSRTVQRDPNENIAEYELVQDGLEQRGASPAEAANAAVSVTEDVPAFTLPRS